MPANPSKGGKPPATGTVKAAGPQGSAPPPQGKKRTLYHVAGKFVFTPLSIAEGAGAAVLFIVAICYLVSAYRDFQLKRHFTDALINYSSNQIGPASASLADALQSRKVEDWPYPALLQAKLDANEGKLDEATQEYQSLLSAPVGVHGWTAGHQASLQIGLGCIALRKYDRDLAEQRKRNDAYLADATKAFKSAKEIDSSCTEADIGLAHVALRQGYNPDRKPDDQNTGMFDKASADQAKKLLAGVDAAQLTPTIDGLVDKYMAQAALAYDRGDFAGAELEFRRAFQIQPGWKAPFADVAFMMARSFVRGGGLRIEEITNRQMEYDDFVNRLENQYRADPERYAVFKEALYSFFNSMGYAYCQGFRETGFVYMDRAKTYKNDIPTVDINEADVYNTWAHSQHFQPQEQLQWANKAREMWQAAAEKARISNRMRTRMICLLNRAVILFSMDPKNVTYQNIMQTEMASVAAEFKDDPLIFYEDAVIQVRQGKLSDAMKSLQQAIQAEDKTQDPPEIKQKKKDDWQKAFNDLSQGNTGGDQKDKDK